MMTRGRLQFMRSYMARHAADPTLHTGTPAVATKFLLECFDEITRLRGALESIAAGNSAGPASTGNADLDAAYNLQHIAVAALEEPGCLMGAGYDEGNHQN